jgi:hypothetical protein
VIVRLLTTLSALPNGLKNSGTNPLKTVLPCFLTTSKKISKTAHARRRTEAKSRWCIESGFLVEKIMLYRCAGMALIDTTPFFWYYLTYILYKSWFRVQRLKFRVKLLYPISYLINKVLNYEIII